MAAKVEAEVAPGERDGASWRVRLTDAGDETRTEVIEVRISGTQATIGGSLTRAAVELAVERRAGNYDRERDRLAQMVADAPLSLRADELRDPA